MHDRPARSMHTTIDHTDEDEQKLCEVAKHPIGIIFFYVQAFVGIIAGLGLAFFLLPALIEDTEQAFGVALIFAAIIIVLAISIILLASMVYRQNRLIVTDRNITQILQYGLFSRKVSQLNLVNVEDVTTSQNGFFSTIFGYGELNIETAGEQSNFKFTFCPRPGYYAKIILEAREEILGQHDGDNRVEPGTTTTR
jgi:uncharacterized membrane protein YdbT with pleckstrin-like domain